MFHTYILAKSGTSVDFDRASFLMDRDLLDAAIEALPQERRSSSNTAKAQWVWDWYCERHLERHGEAFIPDATPGWDTGGGTPAERAPTPPAKP
jgi:hypothetical protein